MTATRSIYLFAATLLAASVACEAHHQISNYTQADQRTNLSSAAGGPQEQFHFGAKVVIACLAGTLLLVAAATLADVHEQSLSNQIQRSPSLSSTNSVTSASAPILGEHSHTSNQYSARQQCSDKQQYQLNIQIELADAGASAVDAYRLKKTGALIDVAAFQSDKMWHKQCLEHGPARRPPWIDRRVLWELFLAFSVRQSAVLIFQDSHANTPFDSARPRPIDSLHGLRFLSMIWVIVIHSYNFALHWLFFAKTASLDSLYKTTASQLLANGSFACDSFLFAGGFLLPYLAFRSRANGGAARLTMADSESKWVGSSQQRLACSSPDSAGSGCESGGASFDLDLAPPVAAAPRAHVVNAAAASEQNAWNNEQRRQMARHTNEFSLHSALANIVHRYIRMMPLMMAIIGLSASLLRYFGEGPAWEDSTLMFDKWCRKNWWVNGLLVHNFVNRENMCLSHSWYSAVDIQLFLLGQLILFALFRSRKVGLLLCVGCLIGSQLITGALTLLHHLPAVPLISSVDESTMNLYYGEIYIKPYCRASPYLIGMLQAYLMRTTSLAQVRLKRWQLALGWTLCLATFAAILLAMQPAMNGQTPSEAQSALYSALSRPLWACATGWMIFACMTNQGGVIASIMSARCFAPFSRLTYPAFLIHPIVMAVFYGSRQSSFHFSHYLMLYLILGNIVITYASAFVLSALFELPLLSVERTLKRAWRRSSSGRQQEPQAN